MTLPSEKNIGIHDRMEKYKHFLTDLGMGKPSQMKPNNVFHKIDVISAVKHNESYCDVLDAVSSLKEL